MDILHNNNIDSEYLLCAENLSKIYGQVCVVDSINLTVRAGEIVVVLGPNGAGKTTTIEICEGIVTPDTGSVRVLGHVVGSHEWEAICGSIGIMIQSGGFYNAATVEEILGLIASYYTKPHDTQWLLSLLGLENVRKTSYRHLSEGQRQRLSLACAIVGRPKLLFLDEPSAGLDIQGRILMRQLIAQLRNDGVGIILSTHYIEEAEELADRVIILDKGHIVAEGDLPTLLKRDVPDKLYFTTKQDINLPTITAFFPPEYTLAHNGNKNYILSGVITPEIMNALTQYGVEHNIVFSDIHIGRQDLGELLINLTQ